MQSSRLTQKVGHYHRDDNFMFFKTDLTVITSYNYIILMTVAVTAVNQRETKTFTNDFAVR